MNTSKIIRKYIFSLSKGTLFTTGAVLDLGPELGTRAAIDQCLYNMVKAGEIIRWTSGVFMRAEETNNRTPSALELAIVKARRFGKEIAQHGKDAAHFLRLGEEGNKTPTYLANSKTSSFLFAKNVRIRIQGTVPRKLFSRDQLGESVVKAFWQMGNNDATIELFQKTMDRFNEVQKKQVLAMHSKMPSWLSDCMVLRWQPA
jgi:hypothetical protein